MKEIILNLTIQEVNIIMELLSMGQYKIVKELIEKINTQALNQINVVKE